MVNTVCLYAEISLSCGHLHAADDIFRSIFCSMRMVHAKYFYVLHSFPIFLLIYSIPFTSKVINIVDLDQMVLSRFSAYDTGSLRTPLSHLVCKCHLLIIFANSLDPDQGQQKFETLMVFLKEFFKRK